MKTNPLRSKLAALSIVGVALVVGAVIVRATPPVGVTPTLLARGTYESFHVRTDPHSLIDFQAKAKSQVDVVVRQHGLRTQWLNWLASAPRAGVHHRRVGDAHVLRGERSDLHAPLRDRR